MVQPFLSALYDLMDQLQNNEKISYRWKEAVIVPFHRRVTCISLITIV